MSATSISKRGLALIALLVVVLWGCVWAERLLLVQAKQNLFQAARQVRTLKMRRVLEPAAYPPNPRSVPAQRALMG